MPCWKSSTMGRFNRSARRKIDWEKPTNEAEESQSATAAEITNYCPPLSLVFFFFFFSR